MAAHVRTLDVPEADRRELQRRARDKGAPARVVWRGRIVLLAAEKVPGKQIAAIVGCAERMASGCDGWLEGAGSTRRPEATEWLAMQLHCVKAVLSVKSALMAAMRAELN